MLLPIPCLPGPGRPQARVSPRLTMASLCGLGAYIGHRPPSTFPLFLSSLPQQEIVKPKSVSRFFRFPPPQHRPFPFPVSWSHLITLKRKKSPQIPSHLLPDSTGYWLTWNLNQKETNWFCSCSSFPRSLQALFFSQQPHVKFPWYNNSKHQDVGNSAQLLSPRLLGCQVRPPLRVMGQLLWSTSPLQGQIVEQIRFLEGHIPIQWHPQVRPAILVLLHHRWVPCSA